MAKARTFMAALVASASVGTALACADFSASEDPSPLMPEASASDGSTDTDAASSDAPVPVDAPSPIEAEAAADAGFSCPAGAHWVCDDFDESTALSSQWTPEVNGAGMVAVQAQPGSPSPDNVLRSTSTGTFGRGQIEAAKALSVTSVHCAMDLFYAAPGPTEVQLIRLAVEGSNGSLSLELRHTGLGGSAYVLASAPGDGGTALTAGANFALNAGSWSHVELEISDGTAPVSVKVDAVERMNAMTLPRFDAIISPATARVDVGASAVSATAEWDTRFDNLVCDVSP